MTSGHDQASIAWQTGSVSNALKNSTSYSGRRSSTVEAAFFIEFLFNAWWRLLRDEPDHVVTLGKGYEKKAIDVRAPTITSRRSLTSGPGHRHVRDWTALNVQYLAGVQDIVQPATGIEIRARRPPVSVSKRLVNNVTARPIMAWPDMSR